MTCFKNRAKRTEINATKQMKQPTATERFPFATVLKKTLTIVHFHFRTSRSEPGKTFTWSKD